MGTHRAEKRSRRAAPTALPAAAPKRSGGRRKATRTDRMRAGHRGGHLPGAPALIGATAILVAGAGAVGLHHGHLDATHLNLSAGSANGTDAIGFPTTSRSRAISRDSERQAVQDKANTSLEAEAEAASVQRNAALSSLAHSAQKRADQIAKNLWVLPTVGYHLTGRFGQVSGLWSSFHTGLDFAAPSGTPIYAVAGGVITSTGYEGAYGNQTIETLKDGTEIWYCHQSAFEVEPGDVVSQGQTIGRIGSTGNTTGPHVHIEVRPGGGDPVDPYPAFIQHGVTP